jgi:hypothetical protein
MQEVVDEMHAVEVFQEVTDEETGHTVRRKHSLKFDQLFIAPPMVRGRVRTVESRSPLTARAVRRA